MVSMEKFHHQIMEQQTPGFRAITNYSEPHRFFQGRRIKTIQRIHKQLQQSMTMKMSTTHLRQ
jgi:hypothetical protein